VSTPANNRGRDAKRVSDPLGREQSGRSATRALRVLVILALAGSLVALRVSRRGPAGIEPSSVPPGSESVGNQPAGLQPGEPSEAALEARAQQMKLAEIHSAFAADQSMLRNYLRDPDPTIGAAAFDALGVRNQGAAGGTYFEFILTTGSK